MLRGLDAVVGRQHRHRQCLLHGRARPARLGLDALEGEVAADHDQAAASGHVVADGDQPVGAGHGAGEGLGVEQQGVAADVAEDDRVVGGQLVGMGEGGPESGFVQEA